MSRNIFLPAPEVRIFSATSSPSSPLKTLVWCRALWGWVCVVPYQQVDLLGCDNAERFLKLGKRCGCTVSTMILVSATHPLQRPSRVARQHEILRQGHGGPSGQN